MTGSSPEPGAASGEDRRRAAELAAQWRLELGDVFARSVHHVVAARREGAECVLKIARAGERGLDHEVRALSLQEGRGAVRVLEYQAGRGALLERVRPGIPLTTLALEDDDAATEAIAEALMSWRVPLESDTVLEPVAAVAEDLGKLPDLYLKNPELRNRRFEELAARAIDVLKRLELTTPGSVLLHGDLHHDNVLSHGSRGWLAIDPHGFVGDPGYEAGQLFLNPIAVTDHLEAEELVALGRRRMRRLASLLSYDEGRLSAWCFVKAVVSEVWTLEEGRSWPAAVAVANWLDPTG
jgi:streptomycin 6-kinase